MEQVKIYQERLKKFWDRNKGKIITAGVIAAGVAATAATVINAANNKSRNSTTDGDLIDKIEKPLDFGRDCLMTFTVEQTGEVLETIPVKESYVNDWKDLIRHINEVDYQ